MNTPTHSQNPAALARNNTAVLCLTLLTLAMTGLTGIAGYKLIELSPLQTTTEQQNRRLAEYVDQIKQLTAENDGLSGQQRSLGAELTIAVEKVSEADKRITLMQQQLKDSKANAGEELDECAIIRENVRLVENELGRDDFFRLRDERQSDAEAVLEAYQRSLAICVAQSTERSNHADDQGASIEQEAPGEG